MLKREILKQPFLLVSGGLKKHNFAFFQVENVVSFLQRSEKGRVEYDRYWAASKEGVDRVLAELSNEVNQVSRIVRA